MEPRRRTARIEERRLSEQLDDLAAQIKALPDDRRQTVETMLKKDVYTVQEVAELLNVHPETVRRAIREKRLEAFKLGSAHAHWRVRAAEIDRFMRENTQGLT